MTYLEPGSYHFFRDMVRHYGRSVGFPVVCDICGATPPMIDNHSKYTYVKRMWLISHYRKVHI